MYSLQNHNSWILEYDRQVTYHDAKYIISKYAAQISHTLWVAVLVLLLATLEYSDVDVGHYNAAQGHLEQGRHLVMLIVKGFISAAAGQCTHYNIRSRWSWNYALNPLFLSMGANSEHNRLNSLKQRFYKALQST